MSGAWFSFNQYMDTSRTAPDTWQGPHIVLNEKGEVYAATALSDREADGLKERYPDIVRVAERPTLLANSSGQLTDSGRNYARAAEVEPTYGGLYDLVQNPFLVKNPKFDALMDFVQSVAKPVLKASTALGTLPTAKMVDDSWDRAERERAKPPEEKKPPSSAPPEPGGRKKKN
jgi:hypothetical protein